MLNIGNLITKYEGIYEIPYLLKLYAKQNFPQEIIINIIGDLTEHINYAYIIYYYSDLGNILIPHCCFIDENEADNFVKYWNDDNGILATGHYYLKKKVEVI